MPYGTASLARPQGTLFELCTLRSCYFQSPLCDCSLKQAGAVPCPLHHCTPSLLTRAPGPCRYSSWEGSVFGVDSGLGGWAFHSRPLLVLGPESGPAEYVGQIWPGRGTYVAPRASCWFKIATQRFTVLHLQDVGSRSRVSYPCTTITHFLCFWHTKLPVTVS